MLIVGIQSLQVDLVLINLHRHAVFPQVANNCYMINLLTRPLAVIWKEF